MLHNAINQIFFQVLFFGVAVFYTFFTFGCMANAMIQSIYAMKHEKNYSYNFNGIIIRASILWAIFLGIHLFLKTL